MDSNAHTVSVFGVTHTPTATATTTDDPSGIGSRVGHYYVLDGSYQVGREKVREYARAVQDYHGAHWEPEAAAALGYSGLVAPLTFTSIPAMAARLAWLACFPASASTRASTSAPLVSPPASSK